MAALCKQILPLGTAAATTDGGVFFDSAAEDGGRYNGRGSYNSSDNTDKSATETEMPLELRREQRRFFCAYKNCKRW